jgi:hypothetical protein
MHTHTQNKIVKHRRFNTAHATNNPSPQQCLSKSLPLTLIFSISVRAASEGQERHKPVYLHTGYTNILCSRSWISRFFSALTLDRVLAKESNLSLHGYN